MITVAILSSFPISIIISEFISSIFIFSIFPSSWFLALMFKFVSNESKTVLDLNSAITSSPTFKSRFSVALFVITEVKIFPLFSFISI